jgi:16S rRNA (guanine527-N7)-methyltransferase
MNSSRASSTGTLSQSLQRFGLILADAMVAAKVEQYCEMLWRENESLNLTRHLDYDTFVARDLNDVLQVAGLLRDGESVLDIGSGGGVPGLLLAILRPGLRVTCCESMAKKARVLERMAQELGIKCRICNQRAEALLARERFDACLARAVGPLWKICNWFQGRWSSMGRLLAFKGARWPDELVEARGHSSFNEVELRVAREYPMLGTESTAYILKIWAKGVPEPA